MGPLYWSILLLAGGFLVVVLELFVPSAGILGIVAASLLISSIVTGFIHSVWLGATMMMVTAISLPLLFIGLVKLWPSTPLGRRILIRKRDEDDLLPTGEDYELEKLVGAKGIAKTKMLPSGMIRIGDKSYDAVSDGFAIEEGQPIKIVAIKTNRILVQPYDPASDVSDFEDDDVLSQSLEDLGIDPIDDPLAE